MTLPYTLVLPVPSAHRVTHLCHIILSPEVISASSHDIPVTFFWVSLFYLFSICTYFIA